MVSNQQSPTDTITQEEANIELKPRIRPYKDNDALRRAQKKYYENNKEKKLKRNKIYYNKWLESPNIDELKAKRKKEAKLYYEKNKAIKRLLKQDKQQLLENPLLISEEINP